jgi:hypothetical protein
MLITPTIDDTIRSYLIRLKRDSRGGDDDTQAQLQCETVLRKFEDDMKHVRDSRNQRRTIIATVTPLIHVLVLLVDQYVVRDSMTSSLLPSSSQSSSSSSSTSSASCSLGGTTN